MSHRQADKLTDADRIFVRCLVTLGLVTKDIDIH